MTITTILPVSRIEYLDRVLASLKAQTKQTDALIVVYDGPDEHYVDARNKVVTQFANTFFVGSTNDGLAYAITDRRKNISNIHNQIRQVIDYTGWVFSIEDDGILPPDALERLLATAASHEDVGLVTGVELGRWGVPYVGAWIVDDAFDPTLVLSVENRTGEDLVEPIDACGLYCALIRGDLYERHTFGSENGLGPDVNLCLFIKQNGYNNYIDWKIPVTHLTNRNGLEMEIPATDNSMRVALRLQGNNIWASTKYGQSPSGSL